MVEHCKTMLTSRRSVRFCASMAVEGQARTLTVRQHGLPLSCKQTVHAHYNVSVCPPSFRGHSNFDHVEIWPVATDPECTSGVTFLLRRPHHLDCLHTRCIDTIGEFRKEVSEAEICTRINKRLSSLYHVASCLHVR